MPDVPTPEVLEAWRKLLGRFPKRAKPFRDPFPEDAPRGRPRAADAPDVPAALIWNKMRGAGINVERAAGWGDVDWTGLLDAGNSWVRLFYPFRPDFEMNGPGSAAPQSDEQLLRIIHGAEDAVEAGFPVVFLDAADVLDVPASQHHADLIEDQVRHLARLVRASPILTPECCVFGPVNEFAAGSEAEWKPHRDRWLAAAREELPEHALSTGCFYWKQFTSVLEMGDPAPAGDVNVLVDGHQYEQHDWAEVASAASAWMHQHNRLLIMGEIGPYNPNWENIPRDGWEARYRAQSPLWSVCPLAPWATTYGTGLALNTPGELDLDPMFDLLWQDTAAVQATRPGFDGGTPPDPPDPPVTPSLAATLVSREDYFLVVEVEATGPVTVAVVSSSPPYAWREDPVTVQPGTVTVDLVEYSDFAKFMLKGAPAVDVPTAEEAAAYEPEGTDPEPPGGGYSESDLQAAFQAGAQWGFNDATGQMKEAGQDIAPTPPPPYVPPE